MHTSRKIQAQAVQWNVVPNARWRFIAFEKMAMIDEESDDSSSQSGNHRFVLYSSLLYRIWGFFVNSFYGSGGFRGAIGGNCPPFTMKTQLGAAFWWEMRPSSFLTVLIRIWGETYKSRQYLVEKPKSFLNLESKNFRAPPARFRSVIFLAPSLQVAPLQLRSGSAPVLYSNVNPS